MGLQLGSGRSRRGTRSASKHRGPGCRPRASRRSGAEGFLILFRNQRDNDKSWWNIGGWGNNRHDIEIGGTDSHPGDAQNETGRWYDIRVELKGSSIKCYLDGKLIHDAKTPGIVRGTAVSLLPPHLGPDSLPALEKAAADPDPLVRLGAATTLEALPPKERVRIGVHLLWDPVRAVRVEAVPAFADVEDAELATEARAAFDRSLDDFYLAQRSNAERPESHVNLGIVHVKRGRLEEARRNYDTALRLAPWFLPAYVNLADLLRQQGRDDEGETDRCAGTGSDAQSSAHFNSA